MITVAPANFPAYILRPRHERCTCVLEIESDREMPSQSHHHGQHIRSTIKADVGKPAFASVENYQTGLLGSDESESGRDSISSETRRREAAPFADSLENVPTRVGSPCVTRELIPSDTCSHIAYRKGATSSVYFAGTRRERRKRRRFRESLVAEKQSDPLSEKDDVSADRRAGKHNKWRSVELAKTGFHVSLLPRRDATSTREEVTDSWDRWDEGSSVNIGGPRGNECRVITGVREVAVWFAAGDNGDEDDPLFAESSAVSITSPDWINTFLQFQADSDQQQHDDEYLSTSSWAAAAAVFDDALPSTTRRLRLTIVDVVCATECCRVPVTDRRLRRKSKWRIEKARLQLKTPHCRTVCNSAHGIRLYVNHRVSKLMTLVMSAPPDRYQQETSVRDIDRRKGLPWPQGFDCALTSATTKSGKCGGWKSKRKTNMAKSRSLVPQRELLYAADFGNADSNLSPDVVELLLALQHRDLSPEDYELLLYLDDRVRPSTVDVVQLDRFRVDRVTSEDLVDDVLTPTVLIDTISASDCLEHRSTELVVDSAVVAAVMERQRCCGVCLERYEMGQTRKYLPCGHSFHVDCIDQWLSRSSSNCPLDGVSVV